MIGLSGWLHSLLAFWCLGPILVADIEVKTQKAADPAVLLAQGLGNPDLEGAVAC